MTVMPAPKAVIMPTTPIVIRNGHPGDDAIWWPLRIPGRIWFALQIVAAPFRAVALVMEMALTACMLILIGTGYAFYKHMIPDEDVAAVLGQFGERILSVLGKAGIFPGQN